MPVEKTVALPNDPDSCSQGGKKSPCHKNRFWGCCEIPQASVNHRNHILDNSDTSGGLIWSKMQVKLHMAKIKTAHIHNTHISSFPKSNK